MSEPQTFKNIAEQRHRAEKTEAKLERIREVMRAEETGPQANLTYLRVRARGGVPTIPGSWENLAAEIEDACDELQGYRKSFWEIFAILHRPPNFEEDK